MTPISTQTCTQAWLEGATYLQQQPEWRDYNLILEIASPFTVSTEERAVHDLLDKFLRDHGGHSINTVVNTIFPASLYRSHGADSVLPYYESLVPRIRQHPDINWGTYAIRMNGTTTDSKGREYRPLQRIIDKMARELKASGSKRAIYELNLSSDELECELPIYDSTRDGARTRGGPCLSHLSFKLKVDHSLILTAFYRSHHYIQRTLGNLFGLAWLQHFVAERLGIKTAELVCISSMATLDTEKGWKRRDVQNLLRSARGITGMPEPDKSVTTTGS